MLKVIKNSILKNIVTLISGNVVGYIINFITLPIISRVYSKSELGGYDLIISSASVFITLFMLALTMVIMIPEDDYEANGICKIILLSNILGIIITATFLLLIKDYFLLFRINFPYYKALMLFFIYIFTFNIQTIYYSYLNRKGFYRLMFWHPIIVAMFNSLISIILGIIKWGTVGYLLGTISGNVIVTIVMSLFVNPFKYKHNLEVLIDYLKKYIKYPLIQLPANFVEYFALQLPIQFFGREYGVEMLGGYTMACKLLSMPVSFIGVPVNHVYYKELVEKRKKNEQSDKFVTDIIKTNFIFIMIPISILMIWGTQIVGVFLGKEWVESGIYISIIGFAYVIKFCTQCVSGTFIATNKINISMMYALGTLAQYALFFSISHFFKWNYSVVMIGHTINTFLNGLICLELTNMSVGGKLFRTTKIVLWYSLLSALIIYGLMSFCMF